MSEIFRFKQFSIQQDRCAMKVGTDGVLLGAWAKLSHHPDTILDVGAGTGLIALMLAQRGEAALIDALEIDAHAFEQCAENFEASPWGDRLFCYHASLEEFLEEEGEHYDLIVSNPPYFSGTLPGGGSGRNLARRNQSLPFEQLFSAAAKLLAPGGYFCTIIPCSDEKRIVDLAATQALYPSRITRVRGHAGAAIKRSLLEFSRAEGSASENELVIEKGRHEYTLDYSNLTRDFYLKM